MNVRKGITTVSFSALIAILLFLIWKKPTERNWSIETDEILNDCFNFRLTNSWRNTKANGKIWRAVGRKSTDYFLLKESGKKAFEEIQNELEKRSMSQASNHADKTGFLYLPKGTGTTLVDNQALSIAHWWHPEEEGEGIVAKMSTNRSGIIYVADLYVFDHGTNAKMYINILVSE